MPDDTAERGTLADAPFKTAVARVNIPDPHNPGMRIVGYRVSADEAQLSDALFVLSARDAAHRKVRDDDQHRRPQPLADKHNTRDDATRLTELRARRPLDWPGLDFLLAQIDARDAALRDARAQERETCAKIADLYAEHPPSGDDNNTQAAFDLGMNHMAGCMDAASFIAEAIRDRAGLSHVQHVENALMASEHSAAKDAVVAAARELAEDHYPNCMWESLGQEPSEQQTCDCGIYAIREALARLGAVSDCAAIGITNDPAELEIAFESGQEQGAAAERASIVEHIRKHARSLADSVLADAIERGDDRQPESARREDEA